MAIDWSAVGQDIVPKKQESSIDWSAVSTPVVPTEQTNDLPSSKQLVEETINSLGDLWQGARYGVGSATLHAFDVLNKLTDPQKGVERLREMGIDNPKPNPIDTAMNNITSYMKGWAEKDLPVKPSTFSGKVVSELASAGMTVGEIAALSVATKSPSVAMGILGAVEGEAEHGTIGAAKGMASGMLLGGILHGTSYMPKVLSLGTNATVFGGMTAVELTAARGGVANLTDTDKEDIVISSMVGGILSLPGKNPTFKEFSRELKLTGFDDGIIGKAWENYKEKKAERDQNKENKIIENVAGTENGLSEISTLADKLEAAATKTPDELAHSSEAVTDFKGKVFQREGFLPDESPLKIKDPNSFYVVTDRDYNTKKSGVVIDLETGKIDTFPSSKQGLRDAIDTATGKGKTVIKVKDVVPVNGVITDNISPSNVVKSVWREKLKTPTETGKVEQDAMEPLVPTNKALTISEKLRQEELDRSSLSAEDSSKITELDKTYGTEYEGWLKYALDKLPKDSIPMNINDWYNQYKGDKPTKTLAPIEVLPKDFTVEITAIHSKSGKEIKMNDRPEVVLKEIEDNTSKFDTLLRCIKK
jgi:hypothetical protein